MTKSSSLLCLLAIICLSQFSFLAHAQFLPQQQEEEQVLFENTEDNNDEFMENTPEEIQAALSLSIAGFFEELGNKMVAGAIPGDPYHVFGALTYVMIDISQPVGDALGELTANSIRAFRDAQETGADAGSAVGDVVVDGLLKLNNSAQAIGDQMQDIFISAIFNFTSNPEVINDESINQFGERTQRYINAIVNHADAIREIVAKAVNDGVSQGGSVAEQLGHIFGGLVQGVNDNAELVADIVIEAEAEAEDFTEEKIAEIRAEIVKEMKSDSESSARVASLVTELIDTASIGADSTVEVITNAKEELFERVTK